VPANLRQHPEREQAMRSKSGAARNQRKKRIFQRSKGFVGGRRRLLKSAKETLLRAGMFAFRDRRARKREFRKLWIIRLSAASEMRGLRYSRLIHGLRLARIGLDRKSLSELAIHDPEAFDAIVARVREQLDRHDADVRSRQTAKTA
jgi:large subunit ribosomal protein L20